MKELLADIVEEVKRTGPLDAKRLDRIIQNHNRRFPDPHKHFAKKMLWPAYLGIKERDPDTWSAWCIDDATEQALARTVRMKPRRTASGVATVTVITKPHPCQGTCVFCPNDVRMPKSYLHDEPACQRAERSFFDPYLQMASRLHVLDQMGHAIDKVEVIVLGGTFSDYPQPYRLWFVHELFRALNEAGTPAAQASMQERRTLYEQAGIASDPAVLEEQTAAIQQRVDKGRETFNQAIRELYGPASPWERVSPWQQATLEQVAAQHAANEEASSRCVGLVAETRPNCITPDELCALRQMGCTKVQVGVQSTCAEALADSHRPTSLATMENACELLRAFGFKSHLHIMANLPGRTAEQDKDDYRTLMQHPALQPDEVKVYPCVLIPGTELEQLHGQGAWKPYDEEDLVDVLACNVLATPTHTRISRMIRDFSAESIAAGSKKANLRQLVEDEVQRRCHTNGLRVREMRMREVGTQDVDGSALALECETYRTTNTCEHFLQWVDPAGTLAGFLRLSLPDASYVHAHEGELPEQVGHAMIREVHVYGRMARLDGDGERGGAQHAGLGRALIERACAIARDAGYERINVISAVGTRAYYRSLGFADAGLYQQKPLP